MFTTALIMIVIYRRQFYSDALDALVSVKDEAPKT